MSKEYEKITEYKDRDFPDLFRELPTLGAQLECPKCSADIYSNDINLDRAIAKCHDCRTVFPFEVSTKDRRNARKRTEIFQPEGIEMFRLSSELNIDYKWRNSKTSNWFMLFFTLVWNAMVLPNAIFAVMDGEFTALLFMSVHIIIGVWLLMSQMSKFINSTSITVDEHNLSIEHRPISNPWFSGTTIPVQDIDQLYVKKVKSGSTNGVSNYSYSIELIKKKRKKGIPLITGIKNPDKALFIEQEIEYFLQIKDRKVVGEI